MKSPLLLAAVAIAALGAGAVAVIELSIRQAGAARRSDSADANGVAAPPSVAHVEAAPAAFAAPRPSEPVVARDPAYPAPPQPIAPPPAPVLEAGPSPLVSLPADEGGRERAIQEARRQRFATSMDALNRRNAARTGQPLPEPASAPPPGGAPSSRRGALRGPSRETR